MKFYLNANESIFFRALTFLNKSERQKDAFRTPLIFIFIFLQGYGDGKMTFLYFCQKSDKNVIFGQKKFLSPFLLFLSFCHFVVIKKLLFHILYFF